MIKAAHITELRSAIDQLRGRYFLGPFQWTDPTLTPGVTVVKALHVTELRTALAAVYVAATRPQPAYTPPVPTAGSVIPVVQISEIRAAVLALW